jgi:putative ABC transport system permease protein
MNLFYISWQYIKARPLSNFLNILILSLGASVIVFLLLLGHQLEDKLSRNAKGIDLVVGAKGSPIQLILSSIFHIDYPTGNIPLEEARELAQHRLIKAVIPMALGDSYQGYRIVGTNLRYPQHYEAQLATGQWWDKPLQAVLGSDVARQTGLKPGNTFQGAHGMGEATGDVHDEHLYTVSGIMKANGSVLDKLILTDVSSVWIMHEGHSNENEEHDDHDHDDHDHEHDHHHEHIILTDSITGLPADNNDKELTTMLVQYRSPMAVVQLPRYINSQTSMQAASPAFEVARMFSILGVGVSILQTFALLMIVIAAISIFAALYNALRERRYDLALIRALGASPLSLFTLVLTEGILIAGIGALAGIALGHGMAEGLQLLAGEAEQVQITGAIVLPEELLIFAGILITGMLTALIPAINAYKTEISKVLAKGN